MYFWSFSSKNIWFLLFWKINYISYACRETAFVVFLEKYTVYPPIADSPIITYHFARGSYPLQWKHRFERTFNYKYRQITYTPTANRRDRLFHASLDHCVLYNLYNIRYNSASDNSFTLTYNNVNYPYNINNNHQNYTISWTDRNSGSHEISFGVRRRRTRITMAAGYLTAIVYHIYI